MAKSKASRLKNQGEVAIAALEAALSEQLMSSLGRPVSPAAGQPKVSQATQSKLSLVAASFQTGTKL